MTMAEEKTQTGTQVTLGIIGFIVAIVVLVLVIKWLFL
jgi:hypothetical protein